MQSVGTISGARLDAHCGSILVDRAFVLAKKRFSTKVCRPLAELGIPPSQMACVEGAVSILCR